MKKSDESLGALAIISVLTGLIGGFILSIGVGNVIELLRQSLIRDLATWSAVVITGILALYTAKLWRATNTMVLNAESTARTQLRAYVSCRTIDIFNVAEAPHGLIPTQHSRVNPQFVPKIAVEIENSGQTPAYQVMTKTRIFYGPVTPADSFEFIPMENPTILTMSPAGKINLSVALPSPLSDQQIAGLRAKTHAIYLHGEIKYKDVFKEDHFTRYRYMHQEGAAGCVIGISGVMTGCREGNEAT